MAALGSKINQVAIKRNSKRVYPIIATKHEVMVFIKRKEVVTIRDLMQHFGYTYQGAKAFIYRRVNERLLTQWTSPGKWCLTQLGERRLKYYDQKDKERNAQNNPG